MKMLEHTGLKGERIKISEILTTEYVDFQKYCDITGKVFRDELTAVDYVAYRSQYGHTRDEIKRLRAFVESFNKNDKDFYMLEDNVQYDVDVKKSAEEVEIEIEPFNQREKNSLGCKEDATYASALDIAIDELDKILIDDSLAEIFGVRLSIRSVNALHKAGCNTLKKCFLTHLKA